MAGPKPHFSPHAAFASASASTAPDLTAGPDSDADADAEVVIFRLLLPRAFSDADAIRLYAAIAPLRRRTAAMQVRVEAPDASDGAGGRVAVVLGPTSPTRRVEASSSSGEPLVLSPAQEALIAVLDSGGVLHRDERRGPEVVTCLVLVEAAQLEAAFGRGILGAIAREAGAEVCVAPPPEEAIEITGDRTAVRKAIVAVSSRLQGDLPAGSSTTSVQTASPMLPWTSSEVPEPNFGSLYSEVSTDCANSNIPQIDCPQGVTGDVQTKDLQQISFRLLCHVNIAGGLIGKKGSVIKGFEDETGASIDVSALLSGCIERVITISALECPEQQYSKVQSALLRIFDRMQEVASNGRLMFNKPSQCLARVLVLKSQSGCLIGLGGAIIKEMVNSTGARIQILDEINVPACASPYEQVLQASIFLEQKHYKLYNLVINGEVANVRDALCLVSEKLRNHTFSSKRTKYNDGYVPYSDIAQSTASSQINISSTGYYSTDNVPRVDHGPSLKEMDSVENSFRAFHLVSPGSSELEKPANGNDVGINNANHEMQKPATGNGDEMNNSNHGITSPEENKLPSCRGINTATIVRSTYEIAACGSNLYLVYGDNGNNLAQLREISGADITIYDPPQETSDCTIVISGTPDQAQSALAMLIDLIQA